MKTGWSPTASVAIFFVVIIVAPAFAHAEIHFDNFRSASGLALVGDARIARGVLQLTPARRNQTGAAWFREKQTVGTGFETTFQFQLTHQDWMLGGADGFAFVVQNAGPDAIGGRGSASGFGMPDPTNPQHAGIPSMIAVFFDTLKNSEEKDASSNYVAVRANGTSRNMRWPAARLAFTPSLSVHLKDGKPHTARITFQPPHLSVFLDGAEILHSVIDLSIATDHTGESWVGFTAATGWGHQNHDIINWSFTSTEVSSNLAIVSSEISFSMSTCLPDRNLCTPESPVIRPTGSGRYHVVLPANLQWPVSIPNPPSARPVVVTNAKGIACWDIKTAGAASCSGPSGNHEAGARDFLNPERPPGSLLVRTQNGQTQFSVNGRNGTAFASNEGFYEFDLEVK